MPDGSIRTFSRGGSDITGAIAAAAIGAGAYENWTDVSGILMADPRIVSNPKSIEKITYAELREMSYMGAEVLHEEAVFPVRKVDIPLYIKNTNDPEAAGTLIRESFPNDLEDDDSSTRFITGISGRKHFTIITLHKVGSPMVLRRSGAQGRGDKRCTDSRTAHINFAQVTLSLGRFCRKKPGLIRGRGPLCLIRL